MFPWVIDERVPAVWCQVFYQLPAHTVREARADADMLQRVSVIEKAQQ